MDTNDNPVDSQPPPSQEGANPRFRTLLAGFMGIALVCILIVLVIQIREVSFYRALQSVWPGAVDSGVSSVSTVPPQPTPTETTPTPATASDGSGDAPATVEPAK